MTPDEWRRIKTVFDAAAELPVDELLAGNPGDRRLLRVSGIARDRTAEVLEHEVSGRQEALTLRRDALEMKKRLLSTEPLNTEYQRLVAWGEHDLASASAR